MLKKNDLRYPSEIKNFICKSSFLLLLLLTTGYQSAAQIYKHNFGTTAITAHPYIAAPTIADSHFSNSSWSNSLNSWTSTAGATGEAIRLTNIADATITLTFNVAANFQVAITSFDFWRQRSNLGAQNWNMTINGISVGNGSIGTVGAAIGNTTVTNPVSGLTGTITVAISLSGNTGNGTFRLDDFTLNGTVTSTCTTATITSFSPLTGPENTLVTINGSGFQSGSGTSSVKFNGIAGSFSVISDNVIKAYVPAGNATGNISVVTNGCEAFAAAAFTELVSASAANFSSDIYISELYDAQAGDGGVIEIYNGTAFPVNLSSYSIRRYGDIGGSSFYTINLVGVIPPGATFLVGIGTGITPCSITENQHYATGFNSNDEFQLFHNGTLIDDVHAPVNVGYSVIRDSDAIGPNPIFNSNDWTTSTTESCADIGIHNITVNTPPTVTNPASSMICEANAAVFSVALANPTGYTFQWKTLDASGIWVNVVNGLPYSGANTNILTVNPTPVTFNDSQYYCQITSTTNTVVSHAAQLEVNPAIVPNFATTLVLCNGETVPSLNTTSPNGITGIWNPSAINNTTSGSYVFTPNPGQCANNITLNVTVNNLVTPNFATTLTICSGGIVPTLNTTSPNGITGTWNPSAINNTASGSYIFTPNPGQCAANATLNVTVNNLVTPNFATTLTICSGGIVPTLNTTSPNGITGTWNPSAINNTASGSYVFTPDSGQCAANVTLNVTVNNLVTPSFATTLTICSGGIVPTLNTTSPNGITGTWNPSAINNTASGSYVFTPDSGQCAANVTLNVTVNNLVTPNFATALTICSGGIVPTLNTTSPNGITGTWNPSAINSTASGSYIFTPDSGQCANNITLNVTVNNLVTPNFATTLTICSGGIVPALNTTSPNGITGTWNPSAINNTASGSYIFTPNPGQCAANVTLNVTVNNLVTPNFATTLTICSGGIVPALNTTSPNGITGTWNPSAINNTASGNYIFTPNPGQCAANATLNVTVNNLVTPNFATTLTICSGGIVPALNTTSPNGITGTWNPSAINNTASGSYVFTPDSGQCAANVTLNVTVNNLVTPNFATALTICSGGIVPTLNTTSPNGITGTWNPSTINNTASGSYIFTPNPGQCAANATLNITVNNLVMPNFATALTICSGGIVPTLNTTSPNGITGTWNPSAINNTASGSYVFAPDSGQCAANITLTVTVNAAIIPDFTSAMTLCSSEIVPILHIISPNGISGTWNPPVINNTISGNYLFTPNAGQCAGNFALAITITNAVTPDFATTLSLCAGESAPVLNTTSPNGITGTWNPTAINNNANGSYVFTPDANQCANTVVLTVAVHALPQPVLHDKFICVDNQTGDILNPAVLYCGISNNNYGFSWTLNGNPLPTVINTHIATEPGTYEVTVTNLATGCSAEAQAVVTILSTAVAVADAGQDFDANPTITIHVSGGSGSFQFQLDGGLPQESNVFSNVSEGEHEITVTDTNGCTTLTLQVFVLNYPHYFTPNGDGFHDYWNIAGLSQQQKSKICIFDRYGKLLAILKPSDNTGWDGTYNGHELPSTDYWFKLSYQDRQGHDKEFRAHFSMKR